MPDDNQVKYLSDREVKNGNNTIKLIEGNIIFVLAAGPQSTQGAIAQIEINKKLSQLANGHVHFLIDLNKAGKSSPEARKIWKEASEKDMTAKVALFGLHPVAKVMASFVMSITCSQNVRFFSTKEEGLKWIKA